MKQKILISVICPPGSEHDFVFAQFKQWFGQYMHEPLNWTPYDEFTEPLLWSTLSDHIQAYIENIIEILSKTEEGIYFIYPAPEQILYRLQGALYKNLLAADYMLYKQLQTQLEVLQKEVWSNADLILKYNQVDNPDIWISDMYRHINETHGYLESKWFTPLLDKNYPLVYIESGDIIKWIRTTRKSSNTKVHQILTQLDQITNAANGPIIQSHKIPYCITKCIFCETPESAIIYDTIFFKNEDMRMYPIGHAILGNIMVISENNSTLPPIPTPAGSSDLKIYNFLNNPPEMIQELPYITSLYKFLNTSEEEHISLLKKEIEQINPPMIWTTENVSKHLSEYTDIIYKF